MLAMLHLGMNSQLLIQHNCHSQLSTNQIFNFEGFMSSVPRIMLALA